MQSRLSHFAWPLAAMLMMATLPWLPEFAGMHVLPLRSRPDWSQAPARAWQLGAAALALWFLAWCWQTYRPFPARPPAERARQPAPRRPDKQR